MRGNRQLGQTPGLVNADLTDDVGCTRPTPIVVAVDALDSVGRSRARQVPEVGLATSSGGHVLQRHRTGDALADRGGKRNDVAFHGALVGARAARADVTLAFLTFYVGLLFTRSIWLGDPPTIPLHQIESGALLIFAFFMISDPKTTPDSRHGRIVYALIVALAAIYIQFGLFKPNGPLLGLIACAPLVPLLDRFLPGLRYNWSQPTIGRSPKPVPLQLSLQPQRRFS